MAVIVHNQSTDSGTGSQKRPSRLVEWRLLLLVGIYALIGALALYYGSGETMDPKVIYACVLSVGAYFLVSIYWYFVRFQGDCFMLPIIALLTTTGLVFLFRLDPEYGTRQFYWLLIALGILLLTTRLLINFRFLSDYKYIFALLGMIALVLPVFIGNEQGGAKSWLDLGVFYVQPSEFVKVLLVLFLASYLSENRAMLTSGTGNIGRFNLPGLQEWGPLLVMWGISLLLLVFQKDLGAALIYFSTFLTMVYVATSRLIYVFSGLVLFAGGVVVSYQIFDHVKVRMSTWINPWITIDAGGYQITQSLFAINAGGVLGSGLGLGFPNSIPAVHTDLIFSAICEEMGLVGGVCLIVLYMLFMYLGIRVALRTKDEFAALAACGLTALLGLQVFIIIAGVTKFMPLTGITLPFVSYGGSSLVANFVLLGLLLNISHEGRISL
ncbi:MAG: FtsW/RodA/SpoVE family cell cycle protein [Peptococcaceae bacterium]|nr:FtsW/RodA/SpoVE family cell cycle protein [Peptococcaceae bacterium]